MRIAHEDPALDPARAGVVAAALMQGRQVRHKPPAAAFALLEQAAAAAARAWTDGG